MRKPLIVKPKPPLGAKIGPVRIIEQMGKSANDGQELRYFAIFPAGGGLRITLRWSLDLAIGYCHENLIPIAGIELLGAAPR